MIIPKPGQLSGLGTKQFSPRIKMRKRRSSLIRRLAVTASKCEDHGIYVGANNIIEAINKIQSLERQLKRERKEK